MTERELPEVSVVVPTHNRRRLLMQTLRSACAQKTVGLEIIVVDDGSADDTADAVAAIGDPRIRLLSHQRPRGVAAARNVGASAAQGDWVAFLDDDDLWSPDKLAKQMDAAVRAERNWVYAGAVEIDEGGGLLGGLPPETPERMVGHLPRRNLMPAGSSNVAVSAQALVAAGCFDEGLRHMADWDLWLKLSALGLPAWVPEPLVAYRQHGGQATLDTTGMASEARLLQARHNIDAAAVHRWTAWSYLRAGRRGSAAAAYATAVRAGDFGSLARMAVALAHPRPSTARRRPWGQLWGDSWHVGAQAWLGEFTASGAAENGEP